MTGHAPAPPPIRRRAVVGLATAVLLAVVGAIALTLAIRAWWDRANAALLAGTSDDMTMSEFVNIALAATPLAIGAVIGLVSWVCLLNVVVPRSVVLIAFAAPLAAGVLGSPFFGVVLLPPAVGLGLARWLVVRGNHAEAQSRESRGALLARALRSRWGVGLAVAAVFLAVGIVVLGRLMATFMERSRWADETGAGDYTTPEEFVAGALGLAAFSIGAVLAVVCIAQLIALPIRGVVVSIIAAVAVVGGALWGLQFSGVALLITAGLAITLLVRRIERSRRSASTT